MMTKWTNKQLEFFRVQDDFHVSPFYSDGETYGTPTWIWSVVADGDLYIRAWNGKHSSWYQAAMEQQAGQMVIQGESSPVYYIPIKTDAELTEKINQAYEEKYKGSFYLPPMISEGPINATVKVTPRELKK